MAPDGVATAVQSGQTASAERLMIERDVISAMQKPGLTYWAVVGFWGTVFLVCLLGAWSWQIYKGMGVAKPDASIAFAPGPPVK